MTFSSHSDREQHSSHLLRGGSLKSLTLTDIITSRILTSSPESPCIIVRFYEIVLTCCRSAFASWLLMNLLLVVVPRYGAYAMMVTGTLLHCTALVYYMLIPFNPLVVRFEGGALLFRLGWCFWLVITAGEFRKPHLAFGHANYACPYSERMAWQTRQAMYVYSKVETFSCNHCCSEKH